jgi:hypothetical protein
MRGIIWTALAAIAVAGLMLPVSGQVPSSLAITVEQRNSAHDARLSYLAEYKITRTQTLANETAITHETTVITARDSQGRQMTATKIVPTSAAQRATTHFQVFDPVAHVTFSWSFPGREATVMAIPFYGAIQSSCGIAVGRVTYLDCATISTKETVEELGTKTIQGVEARGRRTTRTTPSVYIGKHKTHKPLECSTEVSTVELWKAIAPGLTGLVVREVNVDTQSVKMSKELVKFSQSEPDAMVFRPPTGYEIVNREVGIDPCSRFEGMEP